MIIKIPFSVGVYHFIKKLIAVPGFVRDYFVFRKESRNKNGRFTLAIQNIFPCLTDKISNTPFEPHYIYHPAWAARVVAAIKPDKHVDISSTLHFSTIISAFVPVEFYDYRPAFINLSGLESKAADLNKLPFPDNSIRSLSCMHTVEHVGLGRYGDQIDPDGDIKAAKELARVLAPGGTLIFVVPVGKSKLEFNAHRIYSYKQVCEMFSELELKEFSLIPDNFKETGMIYNASPDLVCQQSWGCGCFWFVKK